MGELPRSGAFGLSELAFFRSAQPVTLASLAALCAARLPDGTDPQRMIVAAAPLVRAGRDEIAAFTSDNAADDLRTTRAGACFVTAQERGLVPAATVALVTERPDEAFRRVATMLHPGSLRPSSALANRGLDPGARIDPDALLEDGVIIDRGAVIGPRVEIGSGTFIGANAVVADGVRIGRDCAIDAGVCLSHALIGDRVVIEAGVRVGLAGQSRPGQRRPQLGRVIVQNDVVVGANSVIERGLQGDTVIGEGSCVEALALVAADTLIDRGMIVRRG